MYKNITGTFTFKGFPSLLSQDLSLNHSHINLRVKLHTCDSKSKLRGRPYCNEHGQISPGGIYEDIFELTLLLGLRS